jgi:uncharacterized protein (DUF427 family)
MSSGPGYQKYPDHHVDLKQGPSRVQVEVDGEIIADTRNAITVEETGYAPVQYIPRNDVKMDRLSRTELHTRCPFKGEASYYSVTGKRGVYRDVVWSYEGPYDEVMPIKDRIAFYPDRVDAIRIE